jgi:hypothetical protein
LGRQQLLRFGSIGFPPEQEALAATDGETSHCQSQSLMERSKI